MLNPLLRSHINSALYALRAAIGVLIMTLALIFLVVGITPEGMQ